MGALLTFSQYTDSADEPGLQRVLCSLFLTSMEENQCDYRLVAGSCPSGCMAGPFAYCLNVVVQLVSDQQKRLY